MRRLVAANFVEPRLDELAHPLLDLVPDLAHAFERLTGRIVDFPVLDL